MVFVYSEVPSFFLYYFIYWSLNFYFVYESWHYNLTYIGMYEFYLNFYIYIFNCYIIYYIIYIIFARLEKKQRTHHTQSYIPTTKLSKMILNNFPVLFKERLCNSLYSASKLAAEVAFPLASCMRSIFTLHMPLSLYPAKWSYKQPSWKGVHNISLMCFGQKLWYCIFSSFKGYFGFIFTLES